jgi:hypothetical protein
MANVPDQDQGTWQTVLDLAWRTWLADLDVAHKKCLPTRRDHLSTVYYLRCCNLVCDPIILLTVTVKTLLINSPLYENITSRHLPRVNGSVQTE